MNSWEVLEREEVEFLGSTWTLLPGVYPMQRVRSSRFFWERLQELGPVESFLEIGCGSGALSVLGVKAGTYRSATAVDINPTAVENTLLNARRHGVESRVEVRRSDVFASLDEGQRFDLIFWNSPGVFLEEGATLTDHERSVFDPGYVAHTRYLSEGSTYLTENGRLTLGFCGNGDLRLLEQKAADAGLTMKTLAEDDQGSHPHWLLEFRH
ncbi:methyltransferase [Streptomyces sp. NPDC046727]|uniref:methyltransferase n=1 Tax=Streptomyces sp. NPDC046727 TaxID=3155373 RepID=UPI0033CA2A76